MRNWYARQWKNLLIKLLSERYQQARRIQREGKIDFDKLQRKKQTEKIEFDWFYERPIETLYQHADKRHFSTVYIGAHALLKKQLLVVPIDGRKLQIEKNK